MSNPVDKSVIKLWKDSAKGRNDWPRAITVLAGQSCKMPSPAHQLLQGQAKNFLFPPQSLVWRGFARFHLPPETVEGTVDNMRAHGYRPRWLWPWQVWLIFVQLASVARIREGGHAAC